MYHNAQKACAFGHGGLDGADIVLYILNIDLRPCAAGLDRYHQYITLISRSLNNIIRTRSTGRIFVPGFILFFGGRQPTCIIQFFLTQKSAPVESKISERIYEDDARRHLADGLSPFKRWRRSSIDVYSFRNGFGLYRSG